MTIGKCPHGEFELEKGCQLCILANQMKEKLESLEESQHPETLAEAAVMAGAEVTVVEMKMETKPPLDTKINLCDTCNQQRPVCLHDYLKTSYGDGIGINNVIECDGFAPTETAVVLRPGEDAGIISQFEEAKKLLGFAERRVIASLEDNKVANNDLSIISKLKKAMEKKKREYLDPLKSQADAIRLTYDSLMNPVLEAERLTKGKMGAYIDEQKRIHQAQEEINRKRIEAAEAEMELKGELTESVNLIEVQPEIKRVSTELGTSNQRDNWKFEVVDPEAIPRAYMMPDLVMLNAIAKKYHNTKEVNGVRFYNEPVITVRTR